MGNHDKDQEGFTNENRIDRKTENFDLNLKANVSMGMSPLAKKYLAAALAILITGGGGSSLVLKLNSLTNDINIITTSQATTISDCIKLKEEVQKYRTEINKLYNIVDKIDDNVDQIKQGKFKTEIQKNIKDVKTEMKAYQLATDK